MGDSHGRALQSQELGHPMAEPPGSPPGAGDPLQGPRSALFDDTLRRFEVFGGPNDLRILRNKDRCVRIEESFATVQELRSYDFGASRKAPKTKETLSKERPDAAWPTPEPPDRGARPCGSAMAELRMQRSSAIPWPSSSQSRGPPSGSPTFRFSDVLRRFEVFGGSNDL